MSEGRSPETQPSLLERPLRLVTAVVIRFPVTTILASALLAVGGCGLGPVRARTPQQPVRPAEPQARIQPPLAPNTPAEFGDQDDVIVVVHAREEGSSRPRTASRRARAGRAGRVAGPGAEALPGRFCTRSIRRSSRPRGSTTSTPSAPRDRGLPEPGRAGAAGRLERVERGRAGGVVRRATGERRPAAGDGEPAPRQAQQAQSLQILATALSQTGALQLAAGRTCRAPRRCSRRSKTAATS